MKQISEMTGFSPATVSNALNHKYGVKKSTIETVFAAAEKIGYTTAARVTKIRFLSFRKTGLIIDDNPFFPALIEGVERQAKASGYETIFTMVDASQENYQEQIRPMLDDVSTGIVLLGTEMSESDFQLFADHKCHLVVLDGLSETVDLDCVLISNTDSAFKAVEHLIQKGHTKIGYLKGDFRIKAMSQRGLGFRRAMLRHSLDVNPNHVVKLGTSMEGAYHDMLRHLKRTNDLPTAFFADNDMIAMGAMRALQEQGYRVPQDVSLIGFDNLQFGEICTPRLSTIHVYKQEMGEIAVRRMIDHIKLGCKVKTHIQVCTDFIERESIRDLTREGQEKEAEEGQAG
ncbi:MAG: LacI family DNA-binding transcriptional regulator [Clostridiales bacterium]|nr:LacI family DNA-binding transcriptional regulator [Clostridiales bacterium]